DAPAASGTPFAAFGRQVALRTPATRQTVTCGYRTAGLPSRRGSTTGGSTMNRLLSSVVLLLAVAVLLGTAGSALAAEKASGKIKSVSPDNKQFVVTDKDGKDWTFQMDEKAKVRLNDKDSELRQLRRNDEVEVTYNKEGEKLIATEVTCKRAG